MKNSFWYHKFNNKVRGPYSLSEVRNLVLRGKIAALDLLFNDTMGVWKQAQQWTEFDQSFFPSSQNNISKKTIAYNLDELVLLNPSPEDRPAEVEPEPDFVARQRARRQKRISYSSPDKVILDAFWYFFKSGKVKGPFSYKEICEIINQGTLGPRNLLYNDSLGSWKTTQDYKSFSPTLFPHADIFFHCKEILDDEKEWVVLSPNKEKGTPTPEGPFSKMEVFEKIKNRKISVNQYIWRPGMTDWCPIHAVPAF